MRESDKMLVDTANKEKNKTVWFWRHFPSCPHDRVGGILVQPILTFPKGRNRLLWLNDISPHLTSPRRGGTDTLASNIIVSSRLIISGLSKAIVSVPPLRGRLGGGWYDCLKKSLTKHSNLFLPLGNVRMGYPAGKVRMGSRPRGGWFHQTCFHFLPLYLRFIMVFV